MGDSGSTHKVNTLFGYVDDLCSEGILQVIHTRYYPVTWSVSLYSIRLESQVYSSFLGEFPGSHGDTVDVEHCFSSSDRRSVREDYPNVRGHVTSMCPCSEGWLGRAFTLGRIFL